MLYYPLLPPCEYISLLLYMQNQIDYIKTQLKRVLKSFSLIWKPKIGGSINEVFDMYTNFVVVYRYFY